MAQLAAPARSIGRRLRAHWRGIAVGSALVVILGVIALSALVNQIQQADLGYAAAAAEADRLDPRWRLDDILAAREKVPDSENSVLKLREIAGKLPGGWPGIKHYDQSFSVEGETPEVRLSQERIEQLQSVFSEVEDVVAEARLLSDYPRGQLDGERPKVERLEQVGGMNVLIDANFPYGGDVHRSCLPAMGRRAKLRIEAGDLETAIVDFRAMVNAGRSIGDYPGLSAQMSRAGGAWRAIPSLETALAQGQATSTSLAALQALFEDEATKPSRMIAIRGERAIVDDLFQQINAGKLSRSAIPSYSDYPFWVKALSNPINLRENQATLLRLHTRQVEAAHLPEPEQIAAMKARNDEWVARAIEWGFLERERRLTERLMFGRAGGTPTWLGMGDAQIRTAITALAAERFRIDQGRWPASLEELVPKYISAVPRDPFIRGPLKLMKLPDGLFIYSVRIRPAVRTMVARSTPKIRICAMARTRGFGYGTSSAGGRLRGRVLRASQSQWEAGLDDALGRRTWVTSPVTLVRPRISVMALLAAPARSINRGIRNHWRGIAVISAIVPVFGSIALTAHYNQVSLADRKYAEAAAEVDRHDPHWRLDDILAAREKLADSENSVLKVREIAGRLPGAWRGIEHYDGSFAFEREAPEVRLSAERIEQLQRIFEVAEDVIRDARQLADYPRGQLDGMRPKAERLEQVRGSNAYVDANFPYGGDVSRVVFLLWPDAKLQIEAGDLETAIVDLRAMVNTGRLRLATIPESRRRCRAPQDAGGRFHVLRPHWRRVRRLALHWPPSRHFWRTKRDSPRG